MKRAGILTYIGFYLMVSMGVSLNLHYCGGKLASVGVSLPSSSCCCSAESPLKNCCSDTELSLDLDIEQQLVSPPSFELKLIASVINLPNYTALEEIVIQENGIAHFPNPPPPNGHDRRIAMGSLTYYG